MYLPQTSIDLSSNDPITTWADYSKSTFDLENSVKESVNMHVDVTLSRAEFYLSLFVPFLVD